MKKILHFLLAFTLSMSMVVSVTKAKEESIVLDSLIQTTKVVANKEIKAKSDYASFKWYCNDVLLDDQDNTYIPQGSQYESWIKVEAYN